MEKKTVSDAAKAEAAKRAAAAKKAAQSKGSVTKSAPAKSAPKKAPVKAEKVDEVFLPKKPYVTYGLIIINTILLIEVFLFLSLPFEIILLSSSSFLKSNSFNNSF